MRLIAITALGLAVGLASGETAAPTLLITNGSATVTSQDFEAFLLRVPERYRPDARASYEWIGKATDQIFENRVLAQDAQRLGYDKDPLIAARMKQVQEAFLAQVWSDRFRKEYKLPPLEQRAREIYLSSKEKFTVPERVAGSYVAISSQGRTRDQAKALADDVYARAVAGADFNELAAAYSEPGTYARDKGQMVVSRKDLDSAVAQPVFALAKKGDVTRPIETPQGFVIVKLEQKEPAHLQSFEKVKDEIIAEEAEKLRSAAIARELGRLKDPAKLVVQTKNIEALRVDIDRSAVDRVHQEAMKRYLEDQPAIR